MQSPDANHCLSSKHGGEPTSHWELEKGIKGNQEVFMRICPFQLGGHSLHRKSQQSTFFLPDLLFFLAMQVLA